MTSAGREVDLARPRRIHVVGVGGAGMSAVATALAEMGHEVTGSDLKSLPVMEGLRAAGVGLFVGHAEANIRGAELVTASSAVPSSNLEVRAAEASGVPVLSRAEILAAIRATRRTVAVAGTHGKTTTASMLALAAAEAGSRPSYIIGGELNEIGTGACWDEGEWLVLEADESDGSFLSLSPDLAVVTNLEPDHLERYGSVRALEDAFGAFLESAVGPALVCADDDAAARLGRRVEASTFGSVADAYYRVVDVETARASASFGFLAGEERIGDVDIAVPGEHNVMNACAALSAGLMMGLDFDAARRGLARFAGVARRFQFRGVRDGVTYVDDYAHLPSEIRAAIATARQGGWARVVCVFQPHRYSRTAALWRDFSDAFELADEVVVTDVYAAGEAARPGVSGSLIAGAVRDAHPGAAVVYEPTRSSLASRVRTLLREGDVCLTLGAGDLTSLPDELMSGAGP